MNKPVFNNVHNECYETKDGLKWHSRACAVVAHVWCQYETVDGITKNYILVGKRGTGGDDVGKLNIPCGYIDWGENLKQATQRELWEETGFNFENYQSNMIVSSLDQPWFVNTDVSENRQNIVLHTLFMFYMSETKGQTLPVLSLDNMEPDECEAVMWIDLDDIIASNSDDWAFSHKERVQSLASMLITISQEEKEDF